MNIALWFISNKRQQKQKYQPTMDNPETLATQGTQDTGRKQTKQNNNKAIKNKTKYHTEGKKGEKHDPHPKIRR